MYNVSAYTHTFMCISGCMHARIHVWRPGEEIPGGVRSSLPL